MSDPVLLGEVALEVHALIVDAALREMCRAEGLWPSPGGLYPVSGARVWPGPSEGLTGAQGGDGW